MARKFWNILTSQFWGAVTWVFWCDSTDFQGINIDQCLVSHSRYLYRLGLINRPLVNSIKNGMNPRAPLQHCARASFKKGRVPNIIWSSTSACQGPRWAVRAKLECRIRCRTWVWPSWQGVSHVLALGTFSMKNWNVLRPAARIALYHQICANATTWPTSMIPTAKCCIETKRKNANQAWARETGASSKKSDG